MGKKRKISDEMMRINASKSKPLNPFEIHINRLKQEVLGRKLKSDKGLPGVSRAKALKKRKATLLQEYKIKDKSNKFIDRRIGEKNSAMTAEDKVMARFTAERMKSHKKKSIFNLADDEVLTHHGQTLNEIEKFDDPRSDDEDEDDSGKLKASFVEDAHFGGGTLSKAEGGASGRKTMIEQLIADSKRRKAEKQKTRENTIQLTEKLDSDWKDLLPLIPTKKPDDEPILKPDSYDTVMRELKFEARGKPSEPLKTEEQLAKEEAERLSQLEEERVRRMHGLTETTRKPTHRSADDLDDGFAYDNDATTTLVYNMDGILEDGEEKQEEGAETSPSASSGEEGEEESEEEEDNNDEENASDSSSVEDNMSDLETGSSGEDETLLVEVKSDKNGTEINLTSKSPTAAETNSSEIKPNILNVTSANSISKSVAKSVIESVSVNVTEKKSPTTAETNSSEIKPNILNASPAKSTSKNVAKSVTESVTVNVTGKKSSTLKASGEFTTDVAEAASLDVSQTTAEERSKSIIAELASLKAVMDKAREELPYTFSVPDTYNDLQQLLGPMSPEYQAVIVERMVKCNHPSLATGNKERLSMLFTFLLQHLHEVATEETNVWRILDRLAPHFYDLAHMDPGNAQHCLAEVLREKQQNLSQNRHKFPGNDCLVFLKLVSLLFPTSDMRHPVATPAAALICQALSHGRIKSRGDVARGLFLATLMLEYTCQSRRFSPELVSFLQLVLHLAIPASASPPLPPRHPEKGVEGLLVLSQPQSCEYTPELMKLSDVDSQNLADDPFHLRCLSTAISLLTELSTLWNELPACHVIFHPVRDLLSLLETLDLPAPLQANIKELEQSIDKMGHVKLARLMLEKKRPKALRLYEPNVQPVVDSKRHKTMGASRQEREKLLHKYKREMKGALREIRRDKTFLAKLKVKQTLESDRERQQKVREIYGQAANQQGDLNRLERMKKRKT